MGILDLIFPKTCLGCGKGGEYICGTCLAKVRVLKAACPYCEKPSIDGFTHVKCGRKRGLDGLTSSWDYEGVIKRSIAALKYKYSTEVGKELSGLFVRELQKQFLPVKAATLVPIPIHWHRENVRGFNQSVEVGKFVAEGMGWKFNPNLILKTKPTASQAGLPVEERKINLQGVFTLSPHDPPFIFPDSVILFDDVFTTGSTLKEAAKVLKMAGAGKVWGLTIAR